MIAIIVAMDKQKGIGKDGTLPWRLPEDLAFFKEITMGKKIIMGRKTFESLPSILPGRQHFVISRNKQINGVENIHNAHSFLTQASNNQEEYFIIGGRQIYEQALPFASMMYITEIQQTFETDTVFPPVDFTQWDKKEIRPLTTDKKVGIPYLINQYTKKT